MKLFRGMRALSLGEGNTSSYLKYAFGEIVFVVVGILLAFQIDNWNDQRKADIHARHLFEQIQSELVLNIENCNTVLNEYRGKDTLVHDILEGVVDRQDYRDHWEYGIVLLTQKEVEVSSEAFVNLVSSEDVFSKDQRSILLELKELYGNDKRYVDNLNEIATGNALAYHKQFKNEQPWYADLFMNFRVPEEMIDYCVEDPFYFNSVAHFQFIHLRNHVRYTLNFRNRAIAIHERLASQMDLSLDPAIAASGSGHEDLLGNYSGADLDLVVAMNEGRLMARQTDAKTGFERSLERVYPNNSEEFMLGDRFGQVTRNEAGAVSSLLLSQGTLRTEFVKIP